LVDTGEITPDEAETHKSKNQILRALGADDTVKPDVSDIKTIQNATSFILCSDGLSDLVHDKSIENILQEYNTFNQETVEHLVSEALNAGGKDNITVGLLAVDVISDTVPIFNDKESPTSTKNKGINKKIIFLLFFLTIAIATIILTYLNNKIEKSPRPLKNNSNEYQEIPKPKAKEILQHSEENIEIDASVKDENTDSTSLIIDTTEN
jgi:hypothetical protein